MTGVCLETGSKRVFVSALDWPGWCRSGKTAKDALATLDAYVLRYAVVAQRAGVRFPRSISTKLDVVERLRGSATTDFGAPGAIAKAETQPMTAGEAKRIASLVDAAWSVFDAVMSTAPKTLRKGPRGGGRDRDAMIGHVLEAEAMYARKAGVRIDAASYKDTRAVTANRDAIAEVLRAARDGTPLAERGWPARYAARRIAWHVLDHAWECEDRST